MIHTEKKIMQARPLKPKGCGSQLMIFIYLLLLVLVLLLLMIAMMENNNLYISKTTN